MHNDIVSPYGIRYYTIYIDIIYKIKNNTKITETKKKKLTKLIVSQRYKFITGGPYKLLLCNSNENSFVVSVDRSPTDFDQMSNE